MKVPPGQKTVCVQGFLWRGKQSRECRTKWRPTRGEKAAGVVPLRSWSYCENNKAARKAGYGGTNLYATTLEADTGGWKVQGQSG